MVLCLFLQSFFFCLCYVAFRVERFCKWRIMLYNYRNTSWASNLRIWVFVELRAEKWKHCVSPKHRYIGLRKTSRGVATGRFHTHILHSVRVWNFVKMAALLVVAPCSLVYQRFGDPCCLIALKMEAAGLLKRRYTSTRLHGATTQKAAIVVLTAVRTSNPSEVP
jgi:hypothetical protein